MHADNLGRDNRLCLRQLLEHFIILLARIEVFVQQNFCWQFAKWIRAEQQAKPEGRLLRLSKISRHF